MRFRFLHASGAALLLAATSQPTLDDRSSEWLARLPDGVEKQRFILDCTGCHQFDARVTMVDNARPRTREEWDASISKMLTFAGATTPFPVISSSRNAATTAAWLSANLAKPAPRRAAVDRPASSSIEEFVMPVANDLPHDIAVDDKGQVVITGMLSNQMYVLDPKTKTFTPIAIPVPRSNPRSLELDAEGTWWVALGGPRAIAKYTPSTARWETFDIGMYPHSVVVAKDGAWFDGHFTRSPELIGRIDPNGRMSIDTLTPHPTLANDPAGPIPYEIRVAPDGRVWTSELSGNRLVMFDPSTRRSRAYTMPRPHSGPRRFDIDATGALWIPAYAINELVRFDPGTARFQSFSLPIRDAVPYVARVDDRRGLVWVGTSAADAVMAFDMKRRTWRTYHLPSRRALIRHLALDPRTHDVWMAYGASPGGEPARIARLKVD